MGVGGDGFDVAHDGQNATKAYGRSNANIFRSTNDGNSLRRHLAAMAGRRKSDVYLAAVAADPSTDGSVYASSNQNLWQSTDSGATWPKKVSIPGTASEVDVAPTNSNNVVVAVGGRVLVSTNALGAFTLTDITRNLPGRFVARVAFDPNDPATIYAVLGGFSGFPGGHVFRTTIAGNDVDRHLSAARPSVQRHRARRQRDANDDLCRDGLRRAAFGRWRRELERARRYPLPASARVRTGVPPGRVAGRDVRARRVFLRQADRARRSPSVSRTTSPLAPSARDRRSILTIKVYNVGVTDLVITSVQRLMGSTDFTVLANPATPLSLAAGEDIEFTVAFSPTGAGRARGRDDPDHHERPERAGRRPPGDGHHWHRQGRDGDRQCRQLRERLPRLHCRSSC